MKRLYLVRHGESTANAAHVHGGPQHPLTERGRAQAEFIAERCSNLPIQAVFASTMVRAQQTGEAIARKLGLPLKTCEYIAELRGPSALMEKPESDPEIAAGFAQLNRTMAPGYRFADEENFDDITIRAEQALRFFAEQPEDHIVAVTHGLFLRALITRAFFGADMAPREYLRLMQGFKSENTGLTILEYRPEAAEAPWRLWVWNDHAHLAD